PISEDDVMLETTKRPERKVRLDIVGGLEISEVSAELSSIVPGRQVDDNAHIMLRFNNGAKGMMWASMVFDLTCWLAGSRPYFGFSQHRRYHNDTYNRYRCNWNGLDGRSSQPLVSRDSRSFLRERDFPPACCLCRSGGGTRPGRPAAFWLRALHDRLACGDHRPRG